MKTFIYTIIFLIFMSSISYSVNRIYLSNIDGTAPSVVIPPAPTTVTEINSGSGVLSSDVGSLIGIVATGDNVKSSSDGITWSAITSDPLSSGEDYRGIQLLDSGRILVLQLASPCAVYRSDNSGGSWSSTSYPEAAGSCGGLVGNTKGNLICVSSTCYGANTGATGRFYTSTNSGETWSIAPTTLYGGSPQVLYYDGSVFIGGGRGQISGCTAGSNSTPIRTYDGTAWYDYDTGCVSATYGYSLVSAVKFGSTYYVYGVNKLTNVVVGWYTSTDFTSWTFFTPSFSPSLTMVNESGRSVISPNVDPPTVYFSVQTASAGAMRVYTSTDAVTFTNIFTGDSGAVVRPGNMTYDSTNNIIYFGTFSNKYYKIE